MARWLPRIRNGPPDTPSNPRRITTDPCNKLYFGGNNDNYSSYRCGSHALRRRCAGCGNKGLYITKSKGSDPRLNCCPIGLGARTFSMVVPLIGISAKSRSSRPGFSILSRPRRHGGNARRNKFDRRHQPRIALEWELQHFNSSIVGVVLDERLTPWSNLRDIGRNFHSCSTAVFSRQRSTSATLQAWAMQPRGVNGGSASKTSLIEPMPASARCGSKPSRKCRAAARLSG